MQPDKLIVSALFAGMLLLAGCSDSSETPGAQQGAARRETPVGVITMEKQTQPVTSVLPGRAAAFQTADIRPQVSGVIRQIAFREGSPVKQNDLLFEIEKDSYAAAVAQAQASVAKAEASVPSAEANVARYERLVGSGATQMDFESAKVALLQAQADVASAKAALQTAEISLRHTEIRAPFDGITGASAFSVGNIVTANQADALATLRQIDPIYIDLTESSTNLLKLRARLYARDLDDSDDEVPIRLLTERGEEYPLAGKLDMSDMVVSETTGTFAIRALFPNPDYLILPGMYVRAIIDIGEEEGYLIPQRASTRDADGKLTAKFVTAENTVETRTFASAQASNNFWLVTEGVADGDRLIVDSFQMIGDGASVSPVAVTVNRLGLVVEPPAEAATPAAGSTP